MRQRLTSWWLRPTTTIAFARVRKLAALLMLPYLAWVGFAAALNAALYMMNS